MTPASRTPGNEPNCEGATPRARLELIDVRTSEARKTGQGAIFATDQATLAAFESARAIAVPNDQGQFLIDYYDAAGDLVDSILIDAAGFQAILGVAPRSPDYYTIYDQAFWESRHDNYALAHAEAQAIAEAAFANPTTA